MSDLPDYPRLEPRATTILSREWSATAWAGAGQRLVSVQGLIEGALEAAYAAAVKEIPESERYPESEARSIGSSLRLRVTVTGAHGRLTRSGELSAILAETDASEIEAVRMETRSSGGLPSVELRTNRKASESEPGVTMKVSGSDRQWVGGLNDLVMTELKKDVPWWAPLRRTWASTAVALAAVLGIFAVVARYSSIDFVLLLAATPVVAFAAWIPLAALFRWSFPAFEVVEPGGMPRGRRVLGASVTVASFLLAVAGLVVSL